VRALRPLAVLLLAASSLAAPPLACAQQPPFDWTMPGTLGADTNEDGLIDYAGSAAEFTEEERVREGFLVELSVRRDLCLKDATYTWASAAGQIEERGGVGCRVSQRFRREGHYPVRLEVRFPDGRTVSFDRDVAVQDWLVVSIGDSVASGEGNPDVPGGFFGLGRAEWQSSRCHRSALAGPAQAALALESSDSKTTTTFVHLACSGASVREGLLGGYVGIDPGKFAEPRLLPPQLDELRRIASERHVDAVLLSVGANDVYFGPIVSFCIKEKDCVDAPFDPHDKLHPTPQPPNPLKEVVAEALARLPGEYTALARRLSPDIVAPNHVFIVDYFDPTRNSYGEFCGHIGLPNPLGFLQIDESEANWASTKLLAPLNAEIHEAAQNAGWGEVTGVAEAFKTHGYCAKDPWVRHFSHSFFTQKGTRFFSRLAGMLHPNEEGHKAEAAMIDRALDRVLEGKEPQPSGSPTVIVIQKKERGWAQSAGEGDAERDALIGFGSVAVLLAGGSLVGRRMRRPEGDELDGSPVPKELSDPPRHWPPPEAARAFGDLLEESSHWVHRRVESIEVVNERLVRRHNSVDFTPQLSGDAPRPTPAPIALLEKRILANFDLRDESGASVPNLTAEQNAAFAAARMLELAQEATGSEPSDRLRELCWAIARGDPPRAAAAVQEIATRLEPAGVRQALRQSERFRSATANFANSFAVIVEVDDPDRRRVIKFAYDELVEEGLTRRQQLGLDSVLITVRVAEFGDAGSRHFEFRRAEGLEVLAAQLFGVRPEGKASGDREFGRDAVDDGNEVHVAVGERMPRGTKGVFGVFLRAPRSGILVGGPWLAGLSAAALTAAWFALPGLAGDSGGGAASIFLAVPAALGAYLGTRKPHPLEAALLWGARCLLFSSGTLAFLGAGAVALDSSVEFLRFFLAVVAVLSWLATAGLVVVGLRPRSLP
jgi:hypothetical protein